jgi:hypothetical protein
MLSRHVSGALVLGVGLAHSQSPSTHALASRKSHEYLTICKSQLFGRQQPAKTLSTLVSSALVPGAGLAHSQSPSTPALASRKSTKYLTVCKSQLFGRQQPAKTLSRHVRVHWCLVLGQPTRSLQAHPHMAPASQPNTLQHASHSCSGDSSLRRPCQRLLRVHWCLVLGQPTRSLQAHPHLPPASQPNTLQYASHSYSEDSSPRRRCQGMFECTGAWCWASPLTGATPSRICCRK